MSWVSLIIQLLALRRSVSESRSMLETARRFAERSRRALVSLVFTAMAALLFFSALLLAVIELGLQIDRGLGVAYSGLMISATILAGFGLFLAGVGLVFGRAPEPPPPEPAPRADRIKELLEEFLVSFLSQLAKPGKSGEERPTPRAEKKEGP